MDRGVAAGAAAAVSPQRGWLCRLTYALLVLYYPAWNPQYALYLLPFLILIWPGLRGVFYALALTFLCLAEHPTYANLIGLGQQTTLLLVIICARTALLIAIALDLGLALFRPMSRVRWLPLGLAAISVVRSAGGCADVSRGDMQPNAGRPARFGPWRST